MTVMMLSLAGIPMTLGFIGKFYVLAVGVQASLWWLVAAVVVEFRDWFVLLPARCGESLPARAAATGTRRADKLAVQRRRYRGADLRVAGVGTGRLAAAAD